MIVEMKNEPQWYHSNRNRLVKEIEIMKDRYPQFQLKRLEDGKMVWHGILKNNNGNKYEIAIQYPNDFPNSAPKAFILKPIMSNVPHMWQDGSLCLFAPFDRVWDNKTTAATMVTWVAVWIFAYEIWNNTGKWPRKSVD